MPLEAVFPAAGEFGRRVRARRNELGLSLEALAHKAGLHWTYLGSVERGQRNIALYNILRLVDALDTDAGTLLDGLKP